MMKIFRKAGSRRGDSLIEFTLMGIPIIFITTSIVAMSLDMFEFHNLAYATAATARYISMHGVNGSAITVGQIATYFENQGILSELRNRILLDTDQWLGHINPL